MPRKGRTLLWILLGGWLLSSSTATASPPGPPPVATAPELTAACFTDLSELGLSGEVLQRLERRRTELRKKIIRIRAEIQVLRLDLEELLRDRNFDLTRAQKLVGEISVKESEIRVAHTEFLHDLAHELTDEQWQALLDRAVRCGGCGKERPGGHGPCRHHAGDAGCGAAPRTRQAQ